MEKAIMKEGIPTNARNSKQCSVQSRGDQLHPSKKRGAICRGTQTSGDKRPGSVIKSVAGRVEMAVQNRETLTVVQTKLHALCRDPGPSIGGSARALSAMAIEDEIRELKCRQEALRERISCLSLRLCTDELATLESRQTSILSQLSAVQERLDSSASGGENVRGVSARDDNQGLEAGRDGESSHAKGNLFSRPGDFGLGSERKGDRSEIEERLSDLLGSAGATFSFKRVPSDYYSRSYEQRRDLLGAASVDHLCKSIVMVNSQALESVTDCSDRKNSKYYLIVIQYTARLNAEKVKQFVYSLNDGKVPKKRFNLRLAPEEESNKLTGFEHNAVTPFGMVTDIPVILSDAIVRLQPEYFWLGGGEVDLKLGLRTEDFIRILNPFIVDCIY